jgi:hypothetical protein
MQLDLKALLFAKGIANLYQRDNSLDEGFVLTAPACTMTPGAVA